MDTDTGLKYPKVFMERETLNEALSGRIRGFARYGDGDFGMMRGQRDLYQKVDFNLATALKRCLASPHEGVLNCIPRSVEPAQSQFYYRWESFVDANRKIIAGLGEGPYGSSYISRMDSAPECHNTAYWALIAQLWAGRDITLVRGSERSLTLTKLLGSPSPPKSIVEVITPVRDGWDARAETLQGIDDAQRETVILCAGLVTRPLVHDLVDWGHLAWDLGHLGLYFRAGEPLPPHEWR